MGGGDFASTFVENNISLNVLGGRQCEPLFARDFKISINELIAFLINSEAKFSKVYRKGISKCFLMPAEFRDDTMRKFFRMKFEQFVTSSVGVIMKDNNYRRSILWSREARAEESADFAQEHWERRKVELEYNKSRSNGVIDEEEADIKMEFSNKGDLPPVTTYLSTMEMDDRGIHCPSFNGEVDNAQKQPVDARRVCLTDWEVRDNARELLEKLCVCMKKIISGKHVGSAGKETEALASKNLFEQADLYLRLLRKANEELESMKRVSQILEHTLLVLEEIFKRFRLPNCLNNFKEVDKQLIRDRIDAHQKFYLTLGTHSTSLFYEKNQIYQNLKSMLYKICCVCGTKNSIPNKSSELKNAVAFKELLVVEDRELAEWKALKRNDRDERGALAQQCFHIANVEFDKKYYHILHVEDPDPDNAMENSCCLIKDGKLFSLPACDECFDRLKKADKFLKENTEKPGERGLSA